MSANAFDVLGVTPSAGRLLNDSDDRPDAPRVVVLSYRLWQRRFGGKTDVVGRAARINGESFTVVGVLPAQFPLPLKDIDVITPLGPESDPLRHVRLSVNFLRVFGRLAAAADADRAQAELTTICKSLRQQFPVEYARKESVRVTPMRDASGQRPPRHAGAARRCDGRARDGTRESRVPVTGAGATHLLVCAEDDGWRALVVFENAPPCSGGWRDPSFHIAGNAPPAVVTAYSGLDRGVAIGRRLQADGGAGTVGWNIVFD